MKIKIDDQEYEAMENETVLQVALRNKLASIPSLCYHPALQAEAACRLCVIEVEGEPGLAAACTLKSRKGLSVSTKTVAVVSSRRRTLKYLLKRAPDNELLKEWAREYGIELSDGKESFNKTKDKQEWPNCYLCGICVRACRQLNREALQFTGKGQERQVSFIPKIGARLCIGCRACERLCPSQAIHSEITGSNLEWDRWEKVHPMAVCTMCGKMFATREMLDYVKSKVPVLGKRSELCPACKRIVSHGPLSQSKGGKEKNPESTLKRKSIP